MINELYHSSERYMHPGEFLRRYLMNPSPPTYTSKCGCCNCHHECSVTLAKGTRIENHPCPNCGCQTLISKENML